MVSLEVNVRWNRINMSEAVIVLACLKSGFVGSALAWSRNIEWEKERQEKSDGSGNVFVLFVFNLNSLNGSVGTFNGIQNGLLF